MARRYEGRNLRGLLAFAALLLLSQEAQGQEAAPQCVSTVTEVCVPLADLKSFIALAKERKCLDETPPDIIVDPITIVTDVDGRVFYTGADPKKPYKVKLKWCHYDLNGEGQVDLVAAQREPETWGFRFRPKAFLGYLPLGTILKDSAFSSNIDAGLMVDVFHVEWANLNATVGFRSVGGDIGFDITKNFGLSVGGGVTWDGFKSAVRISGWFAF